MFLLPTLNRIEKLRTCLKSAKDTQTSEPGRILVDKNDWKANEKDYVELNNTWLPSNWAFEVTDAVTMGGKSREYIPKLLSQKPDTKYIGILNDDFLFVSSEWDKKLVSRLDGKNFVSANDRRLESFRLPVTATAWSIELLRALNWPIYPPFLEHLFIDNIWLQLGKATGCWKVVASCVVEHNHVLWGRAEEDDTHKKVYGEKFAQGEKGEMWKSDERNFQMFMGSPDFQACVQRIKQLQDFLPGEAWTPKVSAK